MMGITISPSRAEGHSITLGWRDPHGDWPLFPSPDPVVPDDGQHQQGCGVRKAVLKRPSHHDSPHCPKDVAGPVVAIVSRKWATQVTFPHEFVEYH